MLKVFLCFYRQPYPVNVGGGQHKTKTQNQKQPCFFLIILSLAYGWVSKYFKVP